MKISRENYEIYMLDYIEGNLPFEIQEDFVAFLNKNPDIKAKAQDLNEYRLESSTVLFNSKNLLKKNPEFDIPGISLFDQLSIAHLEKYITTSESIHLKEILNKSIDKQKEFQLFPHTILKPDFSIVYKHKSSLKRKAIGYIYILGAMAASLLLLLAFAIFFPSDNSSDLALALVMTDNNFNYNRNAYQANSIEDELFFKKKQNEIHYKVNNGSLFPYSSSLNKVLPIEKTGIAQISNDNIALNINDIIFYNKQEVQPKSASTPKVGEFLNKQLKEKILKQPANERTTLASIGKFFGRSLSKIFNREIKINKRVMDDGSTLYAFKAGSVEIYTNIKPSRKTEPTDNSERNNKLRSNRE